VRSIGIYPGTFDPIHEGHVAFAESALKVCNLDIIYFLPEKSPRNKTNVTSFNERIASTQSTLSRLPQLETIRLTSSRFTISKTLPEIEKLFEPAHFTLLIGSDVARRIESWPQIEVMLAGWGIAVGMRSNDSIEHIEKLFKQIESKYELSVRRSFIHTDKPHHSSTQFRI